MDKYTVAATSDTPALVIYLLDVSGSMEEDCGGKSKIDVVHESLKKVAVRMVQRATRGKLVAPRYRIAMLAYSSYVIDLLGGVKTIDELAKAGVPQFSVLDSTDTALAFSEAEKLLQSELPNIQQCPAPLICHMTDGYFTGADPTPVVKRILDMSVPDGNVLVENIHISSSGLQIQDVKTWPGLTSTEGLQDDYSKKLFEMSSTLPASYRNVIREFGYSLAADARMLFPGDRQDLVELGFAMSGATPVTQEKSPPEPVAVE